MDGDEKPRSRSRRRFLEKEWNVFSLLMRKAFMIDETKGETRDREKEKKRKREKEKKRKRNGIKKDRLELQS